VPSISFPIVLLVSRRYTVWNSEGVKPQSQKLIVAQLVKKYPVFYWTRRFITVLTRARLWLRSRARWKQYNRPRLHHIVPCRWAVGHDDHTWLVQWPWGLRRRPWSLGRWDYGFESRSRHGCLSSSFCVVLFCTGRGLCDRLISRPKESYRVSK
jgi:hypothetical protein